MSEETKWAPSLGEKVQWAECSGGYSTHVGVVTHRYKTYVYVEEATRVETSCKTDYASGSATYAIDWTETHGKLRFSKSMDGWGERAGYGNERMYLEPYDGGEQLETTWYD